MPYFSRQAPPGPGKPPPGVVVNSAAPADEIRQCLADLKAAEVEFQDLGSVTKEGCAVDGAIELDAVASPFGKITFPGKPTLGCVFARQFSDVSCATPRRR